MDELLPSLTTLGGDKLSQAWLVAKGALIMNTFMGRVKDFLKSEDGPTATEYAVMLALIIVAAIGSIQLVGDKVSTTFTDISGELPTVGGGATP
jgi:pilus assembly protein Flp/PilA